MPGLPGGDRLQGPVPEHLDALADRVVDAALTVHAALGPGLLEPAYTQCLVHELGKRGLACEQGVALPIEYDGRSFEGGFTADLVVEDELLVEIEATGRLEPLHTSRVLTYLKVTGRRLGLVLHFNVPRMRSGVRRVGW